MTSWTLAYDAFAPEEEGLREALTSTGNGYVCARGTAEWQDVGAVHYPGTNTRGGFNRETTVLGGRAVLNEDLVNLPNWLVLKLRIEDDEPFRLDSVDVLHYRHEYDIRTATVSRTVCFRDRAARETITGQPAFHQHGRPAPGGDRVDRHTRELVRPGGGDHGPSTAG